MHLIHEPLHQWDTSLPQSPIPVDRLALARRRWRGTAADGAEFGFDLERAISDGDVVFAGSSAVYAIAQRAEDLLEVRLDIDPRQAAGLGWLIGNLHFQLELGKNTIRVVDDPAVRQLFTREAIGFTPCHRVFRPVSGGHHH